jgi:hypothetical protein
MDKPRSVADIRSEETWPAPADPSPGWKIDPADRKRNRYWDGGEWSGESLTAVEVMKLKNEAKAAGKPDRVIVNNNGCGSGCGGFLVFLFVIGLLAGLVEWIGGIF